MSERFDVVIIGGGIIGSACAYFLASRVADPSRIAVLEPDPTYANASTPKATGVVRHQFGIPENVRMCVYSSTFFKQAPELLSIGGAPADIGFGERGGYVWLVPPDLLAVVHAMRETQLACGAEVTFLEGARLAERLPRYSVEAFGGGFFGGPGAGWLDPWALLQALRRKAIALGVRYIPERATSLDREGRRVVAVRTEQGRVLAADYAVNAAGARGASQVAAMAGIVLPIEPRKRCVFVVDCPEDVRDFPMTVHPKSGVWFRPEGKGLLCGVAPKPEDDPATEDDSIDYGLFEDTVWPMMAEIVPAFERLRLTSAYACHYDFNPLDENAILGLSPEIDNFLMATGFSGHGVMQAPAAGRAIAELVLDGHYTTLDLSRFGYDRIARGDPLPEPACF